MTEPKSEVKDTRKRYIPLESNPEVFTDLISNLGVQALKFQDAYSIDEPDLMSMVDRPVLALVLVFPTTDNDEEYKKKNWVEHYAGSGDGEPVVWFRQTIHNACGLYAILHAISNGQAREFIPPTSPFATLIQQCVPLNPDNRALALENSAELEEAHKNAAQQGSTAPPSLEEEVDYHYVAFVKGKNSRLYEMDGNKNGPIDKGIVLKEDEDLFSEGGLSLVRQFIQREQGGNPNFSLMALTPV